MGPELPRGRPFCSGKQEAAKKTAADICKEAREAQGSDELMEELPHEAAAVRQHELVLKSSPVPPLRMVESPYVRKMRPKRLPFLTGLLARMKAAGGVKIPTPKVNWVDDLIDSMFGK